jgi:hypothetical protein
VLIWGWHCHVCLRQLMSSWDSTRSSIFIVVEELDSTLAVPCVRYLFVLEVASPA